MSITWRLLKILGGRAFVTFGLVTFLVGALLATVNLTSRYALKVYVEDQLSRIPWDLAIYQRGGITGREKLPSAVSGVGGVRQVESLVFLRARFPEGGEVMSEVDGKPLTAPWMSLLAASDTSILPPQLSFALEGGPDEGPRDGAVLALVGPERAMGSAFLALQGAKEFSVRVTTNRQQRLLFSTPLRGVIRLDRDELNRWLMDQTGSVSYVPYIGIILLMPHEPNVIARFDAVATGIVPLEVLGSAGNADRGHLQLAEYEPEMVYLGKLRREELISGWDLGASLDRVAAVSMAVGEAAHAVSTQAWYGNEPMLLRVHDPADPTGKEKAPGAFGQFVVDSTTQVLLGRMERIARLVGVLSLLVSLPLLWMAWVLGANLAGLLMLNERRKLGLMRLRGISGRAMGRALLIAIITGGAVGGVLGLVFGSVVPLLVYERGALPVDVLTQPSQLLLFGAFLVISLVLALVVSRRLVKYAMTISPLQASVRVSTTEAAQGALSFGPLQAIALLLGSYVLFGWTFDFALSAFTDAPLVRAFDRSLDFVGLPLFLYGVATLLASKRARIERAMAPIVRPIGGRLGRFAMQHISVKPHRAMAFLLIVALMTGVSVYPTITSPSFSNKAERGARVQLGTDFQLLYNAPDLVDVNLLRGAAGDQLRALRPELDRLVASLQRVEGVRSVSWMVEAVLPSFYLPGYGLRGVPMYLLGNGDQYVQNVYHEPQVGISDDFTAILQRVRDGGTASSAPVSSFWRLSEGTPVLLGMDADRRAIDLPSAGTLGFLPGIPPRSVTDRQGYVQARVDYLNHLFSSNAYLAAGAENRELSTLQLLIPRVIMLVSTDGRAYPAMQEALVRASAHRPLEVHDLPHEVGKVGTDMFIALALANMRIYLIGGLALALIAILAIAMANHAEDRRTLALLRIRGASPRDLWRFVVATLLSPAILGLLLGGAAAVLAGYGLANYVWKLREIRTVVQYLPTHLVLSPLTAGVFVLLIVLLIGVASAFSWYVYRRTAHEGVRTA
ncbi:MAG TPA: FtsX-like permease family protein [Vicinamibacterales bacterium]|nr:FtsX-like permease family protein [Vicinamibacterales bacterium]